MSPFCLSVRPISPLPINFLDVGGVAASIYDNNNEQLLNSSLGPSNPFGTGGGYLNPNSAAEPGLVYDNQPVDYLKFLCILGYTTSDLNAISGKNYSCPSDTSTVSDFNYPTLTVSQLVANATVKRTVTNVGMASSTYTVTIVSPQGITTRISPSVLQFSALGQKKSFTVTLTKVTSTQGQYSFGAYTWSDATHFVRSPIAIQTTQ